MMKPGAYLINTARGAIVETDALIEALQSGLLGGAGLDVIEEEGETKDELNLLVKKRENEEELKTMLENHMLMKMPNVLITPHNAFNTKEAVARILNTTLENIKSFHGGQAGQSDTLIMVIRNLRAREVFDSRGEPTVEVTLDNDKGYSFRAEVPSGKSRGSKEAAVLSIGRIKSAEGRLRKAVAGKEYKMHNRIRRSHPQGGWDGQ